MHRMKSRIIAVALAFLGLGGTLALFVPRLDGELECDRAASWVRLHGNSLPTSYDELLAFPLPYRQRIFNALSASDKAAVAREHLTRLLGKPDLTLAQRETIDMARAAIAPELYGFNHRAADPAVTMRINEVFGRTEARDLFAQMGPPEGSYRTWSSARVMLLEDITRLFSASATPGCDCTWCAGCYSPTQSFGWFCEDLRCSPTESGCGIFWLEPCDIRCRYQPCN